MKNGFLEELFRHGGAAELLVLESSAPTQATEAETAAYLITLMGTITTSRTVVMQQRPAGFAWIFSNETAYAVDVNPPSGTGITVVAGDVVLGVMDRSGNIIELALSSGSATDAQYIVGAAHGSLSAERVATTTQTVAYDAATAGQAKWNLTADWGSHSWTTTGTATLGNAIISGLTASRYVVTNGSKQLTSQQGIPLADLGNAGGAIGDIAIWTGAAWTRYATGASGDVLTGNGAGVAPTWQTPAAAPSGAPVGATYFVVSLDGTLTNERRLVMGTSMGSTDGGAGGDYTIYLGNSGVTAATYTFAQGGSITVNAQGQITAAVSADEIIGTAGRISVSVNQVDLEASGVGAGGTFTTLDNKTVTYDVYGRITSVV